jgi:hypothetical protein
MGRWWSSRAWRRCTACSSAADLTLYCSAELALYCGAGTLKAWALLSWRPYICHTEMHGVLLLSAAGLGWAGVQCSAVCSPLRAAVRRSERACKLVFLLLLMPGWPAPPWCTADVTVRRNSP